MDNDDGCHSIAWNKPKKKQQETFNTFVSFTCLCFVDFYFVVELILKTLKVCGAIHDRFISLKEKLNQIDTLGKLTKLKFNK